MLTSGKLSIRTGFHDFKWMKTDHRLEYVLLQNVGKNFISFSICLHIMKLSHSPYIPHDSA